MRAARLHAYGAPLVLEDVPEPVMGPRDLLVQIHASSINPIDYKIHAGGQQAFVRLKLPWITGLDLSGTVLAVGPQVQGFQVGDPVYGSPTHTRPGTFAERIAVAYDQLAHKPPDLSHAQAASLPLVFQTAWACLMPALTRSPGQRVLIQAGSGGVGTLAIQIAKDHGAWVATTCSQRNHQLVRDLGADQVIDYRSTSIEEALDEPVHILLDALGGEARARSFQVMAPGGRLASIVSGIPGFTERYGVLGGVLMMLWRTGSFHLKGLLRGVKTATVIRGPEGHILNHANAMIEAGTLRPVIDRTWPLEEINAALDYARTGRTRGKVVIEMPGVH